MPLWAKSPEEDWIILKYTKKKKKKQVQSVKMVWKGWIKRSIEGKSLLEPTMISIK